MGGFYLTDVSDFLQSWALRARGHPKTPDMEREVWMKKSRLATAAVAAVVVGTIGFSVPAFAASGYGAVNVTQNDSVVTIGNGALSRTFNISGKKR